MAARSPRLALDHGRIRIADALLVYLERALASAEPASPDAPPRSYGLAPTALADGSAVAAVGPGEAVWLGFQAVDPARPAIVRVRLEATPPLDAVTGGPWDDALSEEPRNHLVCPPDYCLPGARRSSGHAPFEAGELTVVVHQPVRADAPIRLVAPDEFAQLTGTEPAALDPESGYKGWRLP